MPDDSRTVRQPGSAPVPQTRLVAVLLYGVVMFSSVALGSMVFSTNTNTRPTAGPAIPAEKPGRPVVKESEARVAPAPAERAEPPRQPPVANEKQGAAPVPPPPAAPRPKTVEELFAEAVYGAEQYSAAADRAEPEETRKALALLTQHELAASGARFVQNGAATDLTALAYDAPAALNGVGLTAWVSRSSRRIALADPDFRKVARALWAPQTGAAGLFTMMNVWGTINPFTRPLVVRAVETGARAEGMTSEVRNAILTLGGREWLQRP